MLGGEQNDPVITTAIVNLFMTGSGHELILGDGSRPSAKDSPA
jgi:hypothetical protein